MEAEFVGAYKSLQSVRATDEFSQLSPNQKDTVKAMMSQIKSLLVQIAQDRAATQVEELLK